MMLEEMEYYGELWKKIQIKILEMKIATLGKNTFPPKDIKRRLNAAEKNK